jgi:hypothetical protein
MATPQQLPLSSGPLEARSPRLTDPGIGNSVPVADQRDEFELLSRQVPRDPEAERAFIESKIELIRSDQNLSKTEKERAIEELRRGLP